MPIVLAAKFPGRVAGAGSAFPTKMPSYPSAELDNEAVLHLLSPVGRRGARGSDEIRELAQLLGQRLGVKKRRWTHMIGTALTEESQTTSDLMEEALRAALADADLKPADIGLLLTATTTPDRSTGPLAPGIADRLGAHCAAFDLRAGCAGGLFALIQAFQWVSAADVVVAIAAADTFSKIAPPDDPVSGLSLGDGAGALIIAPESARGCLRAAVLSADGSLGRLGYCAAPFPPTHRSIDDKCYFMTGSLDELRKVAGSLYLSAIDRVLVAAQMTVEDVDLYVPHQSSKEIVFGVAAALGLSSEKVFCNVETHANIGAGSILVALHEARQSNRLKAGQRLLLAAQGGGLTWGAAVLDY